MDKTLDKEKIMYDADDIVEYKTNIEGWVDKNGRFYGKGERGEEMARYNICTHKKCECGESMEKYYTKCKSCIAKSNIERYESLEYKELTFPVCIYRDDTYFWDEDELNDYLYEINEERKEYGDKPLEFSDLRLVICTPNSLREVPYETWDDELPEDYEFSAEFSKKLEEFNKYIHSLKPVSYSPSKYRTKYNG